MGKKAAPKTKAAAKKAPEPEPAEAAPTPEQIEAKRLWSLRRETTKWAQAQLEVVRNQLLAAQKKGGCDWLQVAHEFHEKRLIKVVKQLEEKTLNELPQDLRGRVEAYLKQCASGPDVEQDGFVEDREVWDCLEDETAAFKRPAETPEAEAVIEQLKAWAGSSEADMSKFVGLMASQSSSPGVQEAGLVRVGGLFSEAREGDAAAGGLTSPQLLPAVAAAMTAHAGDPGVQRAGCAAMRGIAMAPGQLAHLCDNGGVQLAVAAVNAHYKDKELCIAANGAFWAMAKAAGKNSPEISIMRTSLAPECLLKVMTYHAWDQTLCGRVRVTLPFITED